MSIKTCAILGTGAVGSYFLWGLQPLLGDNLYIPAEGERAERLKREGIFVNEEHFDLNVVSPEEIKGVDLLLVAVKYTGLEEALPMIQKMVDPEHTIILSLMNGVDSEEKIEEICHPKHLMHSFMKIQSTRYGNKFVFNPERTLGLFYGIPGVTEADGHPDLVALEELLAKTELHRNFCPEILRDLWGKFAMNVSHNLVQAILDVGIGAYEDSEYVKAMGQHLRDEVVEIAKVKGIELEAVMENPIMKRLASKDSSYSTLQDLHAKRKTEIDMFSGAVIRMGKELSIKTPYNESAYLLLKALEEKNEGKFDY